jgi:hypothetical protein
MLAEIFMLQLEAAARSAKEAEPATSARFVPITLPATKASPSGGLIAIVSVVDCSITHLYRRMVFTREDNSSRSRHAFGSRGTQAVTSFTKIAPT